MATLPDKKKRSVHKPLSEEFHYGERSVIPEQGVCNVTTRTVEFMGKGLHTLKGEGGVPDHPLSILVHRLTSHEASPLRDFTLFGNLNPIVSVQQNFDSLLIPPEHPSRSTTDTYYFTKDKLLRGQMTAHQFELLQQGHQQFLMCGEVFRRDEIDRTHHCVFHQMDGVKLMEEGDPEKVMEDLKSTLLATITALFGGKIGEYRWVEENFPFTHPGLELEVMFNGEWLEVLGCGVIRPEILEGSGVVGKSGWAFGIGLERIAMALFGIPDIRLFWSTNPRLRSQWSDGEIRPFKPLLSLKEYPANSQAVSFWVPESGWEDNDFFEIVRGMPFLDLIESCKLTDRFIHPKTHRESRAYTIVFRCPERTLPTSEANELMEELRESLRDHHGLEIR